MLNVLILGTNSQIGNAVRNYLLDNTDDHVTLLGNGLSKKEYDSQRQTIITGSIDDKRQIDFAMRDQDVVVVCLCKDVDVKIEKIIAAMKKSDLSRIIFVGFMGPYEQKPSVQEAARNATYKTLQPFANAHKELKDSDLDYTIIRSNWVTQGPINYEVNIGGMPFIEQDVSLDQIASLINQLVERRHLYERQTIGINTPL